MFIFVCAQGFFSTAILILSKPPDSLIVGNYFQSDTSEHFRRRPRLLPQGKGIATLLTFNKPPPPSVSVSLSLSLSLCLSLGSWESHKTVQLTITQKSDALHFKSTHC